ncbi:MAG: phosphonoacetaldehyde hydrolase, partial [Chitinophagia bacterium]|nr:phosphonoacetaldehyde hydrolase [Chitinophagia bacterium]
MSIQLVVFDMAGTTVHDENNVAITLQEALAQYGYAVTIEEVNVVMGYPKPDAIAELLKKFNGDAMNQLLVKEIHSVFVEKMIDFYANSP